MTDGLPRSSFLQDVGFNAFVILPNAVQGFFTPRSIGFLVTTTLDADRWAVALMDRIRRSGGPGPVWVRAAGRRALLVLTGEDTARVLEGSPHTFASDPPAKSKGMAHFQPDAVTLSRGQLWENRRRFTEAVLDTGKTRHRFADRFEEVTRAETQAVIEAGGGRLGWREWHAGFRRIARRILLGDIARHDEHVTDLLAKLMKQANRLPSHRPDAYDRLMARLAAYAETAEEGSLVARFSDAPSDERTATVGQLPHWLFALADTLAINSFRALALLASHPTQREQAVEDAGGNGERRYLQACLEEAMRLWPTTPLLARVALDATAWDGDTVPAGTQVLVSNTFNHRDRDRHEHADRFAPEGWARGEAHHDPSFNHLSRGPQGCPGAEMARLVGSQALATVLSESEPRLHRPKLNPNRALPHTLDFFRIRFDLTPQRSQPSRAASTADVRPRSLEAARTKG